MNDYAGLATALLAGVGIGELPPIVQPELLGKGLLVEVMPTWHFLLIRPYVGSSWQSLYTSPGSCIQRICCANDANTFSKPSGLRIVTINKNATDRFWKI